MPNANLLGCEGGVAKRGAAHAAETAVIFAWGKRGSCCTGAVILAAGLQQSVCLATAPAAVGGEEASGDDRTRLRVGGVIVYSYRIFADLFLVVTRPQDFMTRGALALSDGGIDGTLVIAKRGAAT